MPNLTPTPSWDNVTAWEKTTVADGVQMNAPAQALVNRTEFLREYTPVPYVDGAKYKVNQRIMLDNGDIVKNTIEGNTANPNIDMTGWKLGNSADQIFDASGKTQQEVNNELSTFKAESDTVQFPMINVIKDRIVVDTYAKAGDSSHIQAINRAILASRNYSQAAIWFNNHDYELDDTILLSGLNNLQMQFAGGRLVATVQNKNILEATNCNGLKFNDIKILGLGAQTAQRTNEFGMLLTDCNDTKMYGVSLSEITGQAALRLMRCNDSYLTDFNINRYSYAGLQVLGLSDHTVVDNFKIIDGLGALSSGASGYGVHLSMQDTATHTYPTNVFLSNFEIHGNNWDGINSHGGSDIFISKGRMTEVKNGIELAVDTRYSGSYLKNINIDAVDVECHKNPWNETTQGAKTSLASGISIANDGTAGRIVENVNVSNCTVKYANNAGGGTGTSNGAIKFYGIKGLRVSNCQSSESAVQGYRLYGEIQDFSISNCGAHDITGQGMVLGVNTKNGFIDGFRFGNSGGATYTGLDAIWGTSTGNTNVIEKNTILTTSNVNKYTPNASGQLRFKQEEIPSTIDPNSATYAANLAGFKVGDVLRSPTVFGGVLYAGWMCTAIDTATPSMTWKRYGATV